MMCILTAMVVLLIPACWLTVCESICMPQMQAILGGSEEIMCDFAMRQAMRQAMKGGTVPARL